MLFTAWGVAGAIGAKYIGGMLFDKYHNYQMSFYGAGVLAGIALLCELVARRPATGRSAGGCESYRLKEIRLHIRIHSVFVQRRGRRELEFARLFFFSGVRTPTWAELRRMWRRISLLLSHF